MVDLNFGPVVDGSATRVVSKWISIMAPRSTYPVAVLIGFSASLSAMSGCSSRNEPEPVSQATHSPNYTVCIDSGNNGAASPVTPVTHAERRRPPRVLVFETSGVAPIPKDGGTQEEWAAARESAVLDALAEGIMESRRDAGLPDRNFVDKIAPRLTAAHRTTDAGEEFELRLVDRGLERIFLIRDGLLQHPPHDFELVRKIFTETNGAFTLLPVDEAPLNRYVARVGCYERIGVESRLAGEMASGADTGVDDLSPDSATP